MTPIFAKRLRWGILFFVVAVSLLSFWSYRKYRELQLYKQHIIVVNAPSFFLSTAHLRNTANALAGLKPGTTTTLEIHFPQIFGLRSNKTIEFPIPDVQKGAITFQGGNLSLSYLTDQRLWFYFLSEKTDGVLFAESSPSVGFDGESAYFSGFYGRLHSWDRMEKGYPVRGNAVQVNPVACALPTQSSMFEVITTITVSLSPDFEGTMGEVHCFRHF